MQYQEIPAKVILFGEHAVLKGSKAISIAINKFGRASYTQEGCIIIDPNQRIDLTKMFLPIQGIHIKLDILLGSGLGSSAIISIFLAQIKLNIELKQSHKIFNIDNKKTDVILNKALMIENIFHGTSSGLDVTSSKIGGLISYKNYSYKKLDTKYLNKYKILIFNSRIMKNTKNANENTIMTDEMVFEINKIADEAENLLSKEFTLDEMYKLIRRNQDILDDMKITPRVMKDEIIKLRELGVESKVTGAGFGGHMVTIVDKGMDIDGWEEVFIYEE